jgi:hypothetical protein
LEEPEKQSLKEILREVHYIVKGCITCFWFWVPTLFAIYMYLQLYMMCISPLLLLVGPIIITTYAIFWEEKRAKAEYGINDIKVLYSSDPLFSTPRNAPSRREVEELVEEYKKLIRRPSKKSDSPSEESE